MKHRLLLAVLLILITPALALAQISGTVTAANGSGAFSDYWCYTIDLTWTTPQSLSNLSIFVGLEDLVCACEPGLVVFDSPAGSSTGEEDGFVCDLDYDGEYLCTGNPSLPDPLDTMAAVKFEPSAEPCNAGSTGTGTFTFYSLLPPGPDVVHDDVIVIKNGENADMGDLTGMLPQADCSVHSVESSFGQLKQRF